MNDKIDVGVIGLGVGEQHLLGYLKENKIDKIYIYDINKKKILEILKKYKNKNIIPVENEDEIFDNDIIKVVSVASYDQYHFSQIIKSLKNKKNIFCEKPICQTEAELNKIKNALKQNPEILITTNTLLRESPKIQNLKKRIDQNYFGDNFYMEFDYNYGRLNKLVDGWRGKIKNFSVILSGGIHMIDLILLFKKTYPKKIYSFSNNICSNKKTKNTIQDFVISILKFDDNSIIKLCTNFGCIYPHFHRILVYGTKKTFEHTFDSSFYLSKNKFGDIKKKNDKKKYPGIKKYKLIKNFIDSVYKKDTLIVSTQEMINSMQLCFDINKSLRQR